VNIGPWRISDQLTTPKSVGYKTMRMTVREMRYFNEVNNRVDLEPSLIRKKKPLARLIRASSKTMMMTILIIKRVSLNLLIRRN